MFRVVQRCASSPERPIIMTTAQDVAGTAALSIVEGLLLALNDRNVLPEREIIGILKDAAAAHENADKGNGDARLNAAVASLINKIIDGGNSVRRP